MTHWHAGWHMPGYLPEEPYAVFAAPMFARDYVRAEIERSWDVLTDAEVLEAHTEWHNGADTVHLGVYVMEMTPDGTGCTCPDGEAELTAAIEEDF